MLWASIYANAQSVTIDPRANTTPIVDIKSTTEGMVMPKMTVAQRNAITGLTAGTQVYCTNCTPYGPYSYDGGSWVAMFQTQTVSPITYTVGQAAQGGIIFWIDPASGGQHGLVAATSDVVSRNSNAFWYGDHATSGLPICAYSTGIYGGEFNTKLALQKMNVNVYMIFGVVAAFNSGGYGDWYVPSINELKLIFDNRNTIGNFSATDYWSSTEQLDGWAYAKYINFSTGSILSKLKGEYGQVRPIRRF